MVEDKNNAGTETDSSQLLHSHKLGDELHVGRPIKQGAFSKLSKGGKFLPLFAFLVLFGAVGTYYLVASNANPETTAGKQTSALERARQATLDIGSIDRSLQKSDNSTLGEQYAELAKERKQAIKELLAEGKVADVRSLFNVEGHGKASAKAQANLEKRASFSKSTLLLYESFGTEEGDDQHVEHYYLKSGNSERRIHFTAAPDDKFINKKISAKDVFEIDGEIVADTSQLELDAAQDAITTVPANNRKVAAVIIKFNHLTNTLTKDQIKTTVFGTTNKTANTYYREVSSNQLGLVGITDPTGDVFEVTITGDTTACNYSAWNTSARSALTAQGINLSNYNNVMLFFNRVSVCSWAGLAYIGTPTAPNIAPSTQLTSWYNGYMNPRETSHELGHNFGARHAGSYKCTENGTPVAYSAVAANCTLSGYGDSLDAMGSASIPRHFSVFNKLRFGFIPSTNLQTVTTSGTYSLKNPETLSTGIQAIRIPATVSSTGTVTEWYYLEYRQPSGIFDNFLATDPVVNGISIRIAGDYKSTGGSKLLDMTPATTSVLDSALAFGKTFTDTSRNLQITAVSAASGIASVKITSNTPACIQNTPTFSITPAAQWADPGKPLTYSMTITNNDTVSCPAQTFNVSGVLPAGLTQTLSASSVSLAPGASTTVTATVSSSGTIAAGYYSFSEQIVRSGATTVLGKVTASYNVNQVVNQPPIVTINAPVNGAVLSSKKATIAAYATSTSSAQVSSIKAYVDGTLVSSSTSNINYSWNLAKLKSGSHTITITAANSAGQTATKTITVTKP